MTFRSGNPALSKDTFKPVASNKSDDVMTLDGTINKTAISLMILLVCAYYTYSTANTGFIWIGFIGGFITALITIFKKKLGSLHCSYICCIRRPCVRWYFSNL